jgi:hypothetical protein
MRHVAVVHFDLEPDDDLEPEQVAFVLAEDLINDGYESYVVDILELDDAVKQFLKKEPDVGVKGS